MEIRISIKKFDLKSNEIIKAVRGGKVGKYAALQWLKLYSPYMPFESGMLGANVEIESWKITHTAPYAHYQYAGQVYGPSFPIQDGAAFFSPKGKPKHPTGRKLKYRNPRASAEWDKAAAPVQGGKLAQAIQQYIDAEGIF